MNYKIIPGIIFEKEAKRLSKKYKSLKTDILELIGLLKINPHLGKSLGDNTYKIRLGISSKNKGKRGGGRVISYFLNDKNELHLLVIYDKNEFDSIDSKIIKKLILEIKSGV